VSTIFYFPDFSPIGIVPVVCAGVSAMGTKLTINPHHMTKPSLVDRGRKRKQVESAPKKSREAKLIKLADKTSNVRAVANSPAPDWSVERRREYIDWATGR
jgi:hypothetical protein